MAMNDGTAKYCVDCVDDTFRECDYIFYVPRWKKCEYLSLLKNIIKDDCIITDVGV